MLEQRGSVEMHRSCFSSFEIRVLVLCRDFLCRLLLLPLDLLTRRAGSLIVDGAEEKLHSSSQ
jgi:hypothetical protein